MKTLYIIAIMVLVTSCTKHEIVADYTFQVGNILCSDGSVVHPAQYSSNKPAIGVIFWKNDGANPNIKVAGYAVSLVDLEAALLIDTNKDIPNVSESEAEFDGAANTAAIYNFALKDTLNCKAVKQTLSFAPGNVSGWFIGSAAQNRAIYTNIAKIYQSFDLVGGEKFDGWYWSSTEDGAGEDNSKTFALISSLQTGSTTSSSKTSSFKVRPIIAIR